MNKIKQELCNYLDVFINRSVDFNFLVGLHDYIKYIMKNETLLEFVNNVFHEKDELISSMSKLEPKIEKEVQTIHDQILIKIKNQKIKDERLNREIKDYNKCSEEHSMRWFSKYHHERDIIERLYKLGFNNIVKEYIELEDYLGNTIINNYNLGKSIDVHEKLDELFNFKSSTTLWGSLDTIIDVYNTIETLQGKQKFLDKGVEEHFVSNIKRFMMRTPDKNNYFNGQDYKFHVNKVHKSLIRYLDKKAINTIQNEMPSFVDIFKGHELKKITFVEPKKDDVKCKVVFNDNYKIYDEVDYKITNHWVQLFELANDKQVEKNKISSSCDYINSKNSPFVRDYGFCKKTILIKNKNSYYIEKGIDIDCISQKKFQTLHNRQKT